jgi:hypothetical protein
MTVCAYPKNFKNPNVLSKPKKTFEFFAMYPQHQFSFFLIADRRLDWTHQDCNQHGAIAPSPHSTLHTPHLSEDAICLSQ